ncbi:MAG: transcription-repair coupling factor [Phycisphaerae bacterium]|nr:transcription-repair coupling factor [Phycisphaerae bacterium]
MDVFETIRRDTRLEELIRLLARGPGAVAAEGLWGSSAPILAALAAERLGRPLLLITAHSDEADDIRDDVETALGTPPELLPQLDTMPHDAVGPDELAGERLRLCLTLLQQRGNVGTEAESDDVGDNSELAARSSELATSSPELATRYSLLATHIHIVAPIMALMQPVPSAEAIRASSYSIAVGQQLDPDSLGRWLGEHGFQRCDAVEVPGDFARRGGIVDVYSNAHTDPVRIEFFGDEVESIRLFDTGTQRSSHTLDAVQIPALSFTAREVGDGKADDKTTTSFLALLPPDTLIAFNEPGEIQELGRTFLQRLGERVGIIPADAIFRRANDFTQLHLHRFTGAADNAVRFDVSSLPQFEPKSADALQALGEFAAERDVVVLCDNRAEEQRFHELLEQQPEPAIPDAESGERVPCPSPPSSGARVSHDAPSGLGHATRGPALLRVRTTIGVIHRGFQWNSTAYVPHHELFHRYRQRRTLRRVQPARPIDSFFDLEAGDHVVHALHGIGRFLGLKTLDRDGRVDEYLAIEFAGKAVVHVPISQIHVVQKYIGTVRGRPRLSKVGGTGWKKTKQRVADAVTDLAAELLAVQARRDSEEGIAYPRDTEWQREFEGSFIYQETEDQIRTLDELKADMTRPRPMDRLLCGDVGYGKTELALRAAFKVVEYGRQVAVLVPTTVLAEQHHQTFHERLVDYPFTIEVLSRFRTKKEQSKIVERARQGQIDILIGTHRLLSRDVRFADLGLVVIDEEQRFGVEAKEKLKRLRATVDLLTLTATPIPRTLHMSMLGIRDISSLATPPIDRRSIVTQVRLWDDKLVRDAILRELNRDGQVYFVHNFVRDIHSVANRLRTLVPEARFVVGHGQMSGHELEDVMLRFLQREADVLVSTNIIESGLDIPTTNTIFINRAERFGLADLHQLRGRVGRSKHRAYAYALLSPKHPVKENAARRLKALEHYSDLGAGFQIAMRDLEIRGAGNILGPEQSGHIEAVGYEMYCQLLEQAVRRMRNEPAEVYRPVNLDLGISATIPRGYIRADRQRMEVYKRLTGCRTIEELGVLRDDMRDAFGPPPEAVETLLALAEIRVLAQPWGIRSLVLDEPDVIFAVDDLSQVQPLLSEGPGSPRVPDPRTIHWRLSKRYLEPKTLLTVLRKQLKRTLPAAAQLENVG